MSGLAVVVVALGRADLTRRCLASLIAHGPAGQRIVVVENGTTDNRRELAGPLPSVEWVSLRQNEGFAGGYDRGLARARELWDPDHFFILNNDAELTPGAIEELVDAIAGDPRAGMAAPKILTDPVTRRIWAAGNEFIAWRVMGRNRGEGEVDRGQWDRPAEQEMLSACALLIRSELLDDVGAFDERFFAYLEDVDLSRRARGRGWALRYVPTAVVFHAGSATSGSEFAPFQSFYRWRNRVLLIARHAPPLRRTLLFAVFVPVLIARDIGRYLRHGHRASIPYLWRGLLQALVIIAGGRPAPLREIPAGQPSSTEKSGGSRRRFGL